MNFEIVNEMGSTLVNMDDVERVALEGVNVLVIHRRTGSGKQWTDTFPFSTEEAAQVEYMNIKEQLCDLQALSSLRPHRMRPVMPRPAFTMEQPPVDVTGLPVTSKDVGSASPGVPLPGKDENGKTWLEYRADESARLGGDPGKVKAVVQDVPKAAPASVSTAATTEHNGET